MRLGKEQLEYEIIIYKKKIREPAAHCKMEQLHAFESALVSNWQQ